MTGGNNGCGTCNASNETRRTAERVRATLGGLPNRADPTSGGNVLQWCPSCGPTALCYRGQEGRGAGGGGRPGGTGRMSE